MVSGVVNTYYVVKSIHNMTVLVTFGVAFIYPLAFAVATRNDPRSLPALHRLESTIERKLIIPGLLVVILTGVDITSIAHHWGQFFVQWGLSAAVVIGVVVLAVMIPGAERAATLAERDVAASAGGAEGGAEGAEGDAAAGAEGAAGTVSLSGEYRALVRRLLLLGLLLSGLVFVTVLLMAVGFNP